MLDRRSPTDRPVFLFIASIKAAVFLGRCSLLKRFLLSGLFVFETLCEPPISAAILDPRLDIRECLEIFDIRECPERFDVGDMRDSSILLRLSIPDLFDSSSWFPKIFEPLLLIDRSLCFLSSDLLCPPPNDMLMTECRMVFRLFYFELPWFDSSRAATVRLGFFFSSC